MSARDYIEASLWGDADRDLIAPSAARQDALARALIAVLDIHREKHGIDAIYASGKHYPENDADEPVRFEPYTMCEGCSASPYPCRTIRAIHDAIGEA